jgi:homoserine dehydrogenase
VIGLFGCGNVGGGVCEILQRPSFAAALGVSVRIAKICVQDLSKHRDFRVPDGTQFVTAFEGKLLQQLLDCSSLRSF